MEMLFNSKVKFRKCFVMFCSPLFKRITVVYLLNPIQTDHAKANHTKPFTKKNKKPMNPTRFIQFILSDDIFSFRNSIIHISMLPQGLGWKPL
jgi:hypothetical protein